MLAATSATRPARRGDAIIWQAFAALALPVGVLYFFVGPDPETLIYQAFSVSAVVGILVGSGATDLRRHTTGGSSPGA